MFDSPVLDVLIGLALVFAVFSVAVSRINEAVLTVLRLRARSLEEEIRRLLDGGDGPQDPDSGSLTDRLFNGPLRALRSTGSGTPPPAMTGQSPAVGSVRRARVLGMPSYIPSQAFATGVMALLEPPARAMLRHLDPATLPDDARAAYQAAAAELTPATAQALAAAIPTTDAAARTTAAAVVTLAAAGPAAPLATEIAKLPDGTPLKDALLAIVARAGADVDKIAQGLAQWYDDTMDRLSGVYKRRVQRFILAWSLILVVGCNLDVVSVTRTLWSERAVRDVVVSTAQDRVAAGQPGPASGGTAPAGPASVGDVSAAADEAARAVRDTSSLDLPIGWGGDGPRRVPDTVGDWLLKILGWAVATLALLLGAPFWFDLLGRLVNMRNSGPKPAPAPPAG